MEIKSPIALFKFWLLGSVFLLGSCSSTKIAINVVLPPENQLSEKVETIALINGVNPNGAETNQYINGQVVAQFNGSTDYLVKNTFVKMESIFNNGQYFKAFDTALYFLPKMGNFRSKTMPVALMQKACAVLPVDAIVTIEAYSADIDTDSEVRYSTPVDRNYGTVRVPYFDGEQNVFMKMLFRAYLCNTRVGELDAQVEVSTQVSMSATGSTPYEVNQRMAGAGSILVEASSKIAIDYAGQIGPRRSTATRKLYTKGNEQLVEAFRLASLGDWKGANDIWYLVATSNNKSDASRATYNLIVGNEVMGNYTEAFELAKICLEKFEMKQVQTYVETLKVRESEIQEVKRLFPFIII